MSRLPNVGHLLAHAALSAAREAGAAASSSGAGAGTSDFGAEAGCGRWRVVGAEMRADAVGALAGSLEGLRLDGGERRGSVTAAAGQSVRSAALRASALAKDQRWSPHATARALAVERGAYVVNPSGDLAGTAAALVPELAALNGPCGRWHGSSGVPPSADEMRAMLRGSDVFVFCGHGSGGQYVSQQGVGALERCATALLMGCSSGKLRGSGCFEPAGMAHAYLNAGSPAVVANLWDVTDRDIDRFSVALLHAWLRPGAGHEGHRGGLLPSVRAARGACRMAHLVGSAPVVFGLPVGPVLATRSHRDEPHPHVEDRGVARSCIKQGRRRPSRARGRVVAFSLAVAE